MLKIDRAIIIESYLLCGLNPSNNGGRLLFLQETNESNDVSDAKLKCSLNWLNRGLNLALIENEALHIHNISIAFIEISQSCLFVKPEIFLPLGRAISSAISKLHESLFAEWRCFFHAIMGLLEQTSSSKEVNETVMSQLIMAGEFARYYRATRDSYMKLMAIAFQNIPSTGVVKDHSVLDLFNCLVDRKKSYDVRKLTQQFFSLSEDIFNECSPYVDFTWTLLELVKLNLGQGQFQSVEKLLKIGTNTDRTPFENWFQYYKDAYGISLAQHTGQNLLQLTKNFERLSNLILHASLNGDHDFVIYNSILFWNLIYPLLKDEAHGETTRLLEMVHKSLLRVPGDHSNLKEYIENEIFRYYGVKDKIVNEDGEDNIIRNGICSFLVITPI